jgi:hypothetical protein
MIEQNELLEAALKLAESIRPYSLSEEERALIEVIEQHRPQAKRIEGWINLYHDSKPGGSIWPTEQEAKQNCGINGVRQVHIREVVSLEWKPWTVEMVRNHRNFQETADLHNAEMERVTK